MLTVTHCPQICWSIGQTIMYNGGASLESSHSDSMQHLETPKPHHEHGVASKRSSISRLRCKATLQQSVYLPQICILLDAVLLNIALWLATRTSLQGGHFWPYTGNWTKCRGWVLFRGWALFCETMVVNFVCWDNRSRDETSEWLNKMMLIQFSSSVPIG